VVLGVGVFVFEASEKRFFCVVFEVEKLDSVGVVVSSGGVVQVDFWWIGAHFLCKFDLRL